MELISQLSQYDFVEISYLAKGSFATAYKCLDKEQQPNIILVIDSINECQNRLKMSDILKDVHNCHILKQLNNINLNSNVLIGKFYESDMRNHIKMLSLNQKLDFFRELLVLVKQVHDKGVYHMDLKPSNIMVQDGKPVLIDFGQSVTEAEVDSVLNTSAYAPKHDVYSCNVIPEKFDIYCLGNMLHEIYIGQPLPAPINLLSRQYHQLQDKVGIIATHLISGMTCQDQKQRLTINQCNILCLPNKYNRLLKTLVLKKLFLNTSKIQIFHKLQSRLVIQISLLEKEQHFRMRIQVINVAFWDKLQIYMIFAEIWLYLAFKVVTSVQKTKSELQFFIDTYFIQKPEF
ncbi:Kinase [Hexamita inflata]|uniref:Kinase n=1 Tax=Hexamita inflata TaxID=28002 RepID=A0ABP1HPI1_9EUKA